MSVFALIDCNNFFVSCERVFRPDLTNKPVVVLSNNDGCIISRSNEAKANGVPMGAPLFKYKDSLRASQTTVFSANFALYGDFSRRVMQVLSQFGPLEIYSIDEAFLDLGHVHPTQLQDFGKEICDTIYKHTGIPVSVGIASTKTLAKIANEIAKLDSRSSNLFQGSFSFVGKENLIDTFLQGLPVSDIWGIGSKSSKKLTKQGIFTAKDFKYTNPEWVKANLKIIGLKTQRELNNISCLDLELVSEAKKGIASTRSFGKNVESLEELKEAVASYVALAGAKLRKQKSVAGYLYVFITTSRFHKLSYYYAGDNIKLPVATNYTPDLINQAHRLLSKIYKKGYKYKKAGIYLSDICPQNVVQIDLFGESSTTTEKKDRAMKVTDKINFRYSTGGIQLASEGMKKLWTTNSDFCSPKYTTEWSQLPVIKI
jgi:DNA polymerase V